ncbi:MAG: putative bifunctional diguanylate cyclase/phosphodiesterase [Rhodocyclaceae bacterium]
MGIQTKAMVRLAGTLEEFISQCPAFDALESAVAVWDQHELRYANSAFVDLNDAVRDTPENLQRHATLLACPGFAGWLESARASGKEQTRRQTVYYAARIKIDLTFCIHPLVGTGGQLQGSILTIGEESVAFDRRHLARLQEDRIRLANRIQLLDQEKAKSDGLLKLLLRDAPAAMLMLNERRQILQANRAAEILFGVPIMQMIGRTCDLVLKCLESHGHCPALRHGRLDGVLCEGAHADGRQLAMLQSAAVLESAGSKVIVETFIDMTARHAAESRVAHLAHHDVLTGLLNRFSLKDKLEQALATAERDHASLAVIFIDLDRFKTINDTLGHATGDTLLIEVARRLHGQVRDSDIVARFGGDEFVVILTDVDGARAAAHVADKLLQRLGEPYWIADRWLHSTPSIGIALYPDDGRDIETLLKNADSAMYHAKAEGRNNVQFFTAALNEFVSERLRLEAELRVALEARQLVLHYQPQVDAGGRCVCMEALVRWQHPSEGLLPPIRFIPAAEESGLIRPLGEWVIQEACRQLKAWRDQGIRDMKIAVNLSAEQLLSPDLLRCVQQALEANSLSGKDLELEITESAAMHKPAEGIRQLMALRDLGIGLAIDDFGTGYSSLSYLKQLPIQALKLDQSFVRDIETDFDDVAICTATIGLAHNLGLKIVAEGVESAPQNDFLQKHRCDLLQGFLISKPLPASEAFDFIMRNAEACRVPDAK